MRKLNDNLRRRCRAVMMAGVAAAAVAAAGCGDWLSVTNPGAIEGPVLQDTTYIGLMTDGVIGDFQPALAWDAFFGGIFSDELHDHHSYFENVEIDQRNINENNGTYTLAIYNGLHRARFLADSVATRIKNLEGDSASRDVRLAQVLSYGAYTYALLGEQYCTTPLNLSAPVSSEDLLKMSVDRATEAVTVALAAKGVAAEPEAVALADSVANFARVIAARASLDLGDNANATQYASAVTPAYSSVDAPGFAYYAYYQHGATFSENRRIGNPFWEFASAGGSWVSVSGTPFEGLNDPRVPVGKEPRSTADGTLQWVPNSPPSFSTYTGTMEGGLFDATSTIRIASALEARYILAEAQGVSPDNIAFVNQRRAIGNQPPLPASTSQDDYAAALREQRARDFFLDAHRIGDLRRYKKLYNVDLWPHGSYFGSTTESYGDQECWPIPLSEKTGGNTNLDVVGR